jgi:hypothetical protein
MVTRSAVRLTLGFLLCGIATAAWATGEYIPEIRFVSRSGQDPKNNLSYFHGRLGVLRPTFDDNRLFAAYRQLMGGTFTDGQAQELLKSCCDAPVAAPGDTAREWGEVRKRVLSSPPPETGSGPSRNRPPELAALDVTCFPQAYRNAAATLVQRIQEHGATDPSLREWTTAEDTVLSNCWAETAVPVELPATEPAWLKADRAYQIATAYFYRYDYARAAGLYTAIGQDATSPWRKLGRYLAARAAVHAAIVAKTPDSIAAAQTALDGIAGDPALAEYHNDAPHLASMLAFGTRPQERAQELAKSLLGAELPATLAVDVHDLRDLERSGKRYTDVGAWIYDINVLNSEKGRQNSEVKADVLTRWRNSHALPWLVAAMMFVGPDDSDSADVMAAAQAIEANSPAYHTLGWNRMRLLIGQGKTDDARAELDQLLADSSALPEGVGNLLRYHRLKLARDVGEYVKFAPRRGEFLMYVRDENFETAPIALPLPPKKWGRYNDSVLGWRSELSQKDPLFLDTDAVFGMTVFMPLPMLAQVVLTPGLPANIKRDLGLAVWTRAVLLDDADTAKSMADAIAPFFPQFADNWKTYRNAGDADRKKFEAALLLLKLPAARPYAATGLGYTYKRDQIGRFGPRWWRSEQDLFDSMDDNGIPVLCSDCGLPMPLVAPPFITDKDKETAKANNERLRKLPDAPSYLGSIVIPWAKAHPNDPRVPEALHLVVRATQYGEQDSDTSKAAYDLLQSRFRRSPWTAKTPKWF